MHVFWRTTFVFDKSETTGVVFGRVAEVLEEQGVTGARFACSVPPSQASVLTRLIRRFPDLADLRFEAERAILLSNLPAPWKEASPGAERRLLPLDVLGAIAAGTPTSFPTDWSTFAFLDVPWVRNDGALLAPASPPSAQFPTFPSDGVAPGFLGVVLASSWWTPRRRVELTAIVPTDRADDERVPEPREDVRHGLARLGKVRESFPEVFPDAAEAVALAAAGRKATDLVSAAAAGVTDRLLALSGAHALPTEPPGMQGSGLTSPHKPVIVRATKPLGYRWRGPRTTPGRFVLTKATSGGHVLELSIDVGTWSHRCAPELLLRGPGWGVSLPVIAAPGARGADYPIDSDDTFARAIGNVALLAREAELALVPSIEAFYPPPPQWWAQLALG